MNADHLLVKCIVSNLTCWISFDNFVIYYRHERLTDLKELFIQWLWFYMIINHSRTKAMNIQIGWFTYQPCILLAQQYFKTGMNGWLSKQPTEMNFMNLWLLKVTLIIMYNVYWVWLYSGFISNNGSKEREWFCQEDSWTGSMDSPSLPSLPYWLLPPHPLPLCVQCAS